MKGSFRDTIYLFACGARGIKPVIEHEPDIYKIHDSAVSQGIWRTTFLALKQFYDEGKNSVADMFIQRWHKDLIFLTIKETRRRLAVRNTIYLLEKNGVKCCLLKGEVIAELYYNPICRVSSDTDILIDKELESKAVKILKKNKYDVRTRSATSHHSRCFHPEAGLIELHISLYDELFEDVWFNNEINNKEGYRQIKTSQGYEYTTLGINDGLIYTALHFIKHFLTKGVGIRQLLDLLLYMTHYKDEIDWDRFNELMKHLKYDKFIANTVGIGIEYLGFDRSELPEYEYDNDMLVKILDDIEKGGVFGQEDLQRKDFYKLYTEKRFGKFKDDDYGKYMNRWKKVNIRKLIFPRIASMAIKFPYVKKNKLLLPVAWVHRILKLGLDVAKKRKTIKQYVKYQAPENNEVLEGRMELIKELDMI